MKRREGISDSRKVGVEEAKQRRDNTEAVTQMDNTEVETLGQHNPYAEADAVSDKGGIRSSPRSESRQGVCESCL